MSLVLISSLIEKLGWTLFHSLWQFAGVATVLWLMLRAMRDSSPSARYRVQFCGLVSMVLLAGATFCTSETLSTDTVQGMNSTLAAEVPSQPTVAADVAEETISPQFNGAEALIPETADERVASALVQESLSATATASSQRSLSDQFHRWREATLTAVAPWLTTMMSAWLLGVALLSVRPLVGWRSVRRLRRVGIVDAPQSAIDAMRDVSQKLGISRAITIVESTLVEVPTVIGWLRPLILLPASAVTGLSREQLEAVIAHELAHVRRYDYLVNAIQVLLETIFYYHPAVWWVSRSMRIERERCCDEIAVGLTGKRTEYAKLLLRLEETRGTAVIVNPALSATGGTLMERIKSLTDTRTGQSSGGGFLPAAILISVFVGCGLLIAMSGSLSQFALAEDHNEFAWDDLNGASCFMNDNQVMMSLHTDKQVIAVVIAQLPQQRESETMNSSGDRTHHSFHWTWGAKRLDVRLDREDQDQLQINSQKVSLSDGRVIYWDADFGAIDQRTTLRDAPLTIKTSFPTKQQREQFQAWLERIREEFSIVSSVERISQKTNPEPIDIGGTPTSAAGIAFLQRQRPELQINVDSITREFLKAIAGDSTFGGDSTTHVGQRQSIANWQAALEHGGLTREQKVFAWWRIGSLAAYNFDVNSGETHDYDLAAKAFEQVHAIGGDLISRETLNAATVYSSLGRDAEERAARREIAHRWLNTRTDAMIADSVQHINHNGYCIDDDLMPGGMNLDTDAKKQAFLMEMLTSCQRSPAPFESANDSPWPVLPDKSDPETTANPFSNNQAVKSSATVFRQDDDKTLQELYDKINNAPQRLHGMALYERNAMGWKWKVYLPPGKSWQIKGKVGRVPRGVNDLPMSSNQMKAIDIAPSVSGRILDLEGHISSDGHGGEWLITVEADGNVFQGVDFAMWSLRRSEPASEEQREAAEYVLGIRNSGSVSMTRGSELGVGRVTSKINDELALVRWCYELKDEAEVSDGPGFMIWIAQKEPSKKAAPTPIQAAAQRVLHAAGTPAWQLASVDEQPTVDFDGLMGYQIVLRRTWKEFTNVPQSAETPGEDKGPFILKHEDWDFVLFPSQSKKDPVVLKKAIPWAKNDSPYHTRDVYLGEGLGFVWYTHGTLFGQETVRSKLKLQGGDDRIGLLLDGLRFEDSANSCQYALAQLGDEAMPAIENAMEQSNDSTLMVRLARTLGLMQTDKSTDLLLRLYGSKSDELRNSIAYALIHRPFREKAKDAYLDMLQRHLRVYEACEACVQFDWQEALPVLNDLIDQPADLRELSHTIPARRTLQRNPIGQELLDAKQSIIKAGYNPGLDIAQPRKVLLDSDDTEATLLIAIELATYTSKGVSSLPNEVGVELLKSFPRPATAIYLQHLIDSNQPENRKRAQELLQSVLNQPSRN
ncbi:M56 family metallopeptidase [Stieleria varia]|uniref:Regulatory protein BlaR1 n=1 Tax=Stieleria varia TaxID=2528005 RepID=A0A5C6AZM4_9BACT|nr:M56 family metallopeptidase [Stieleria varia]TWU04801.1 Regulatory protein BlaR1 [Stieleria varia]